MGVISKAYTKEDVVGMDAEALRAAVPELLTAFNEGGRSDMNLWQIYHEAACRLDATRQNAGSQNEWRQKLLDEGTPDPVAKLEIA
ncbi:MAG: hypothetical protein JWO78_1623 [Micavibrio sp.]|nr:hypothetical protein [Micavibrio sp.]